MSAATSKPGRWVLGACRHCDSRRLWISPDGAVICGGQACPHRGSPLTTAPTQRQQITAALDRADRATSNDDEITALRDALVACLEALNITTTEEA